MDEQMCTVPREELMILLRDQIELWDMAAPYLNDLDDRLFRVRFMDLHKPTITLRAMLARLEEKHGRE